MALAFILSFLRLQKVAADQHHPVIFGRKISSFGRSTSTAPIPLKRIRNALVENDLLTYTPSSLIEEEIKPISSGEEIVSMSIISSSSFMSFDIMTSTEEEMSMVSTFCMSMPDGSMLDVDDDHYFGETIVSLFLNVYSINTSVIYNPLPSETHNFCSFFNALLSFAFFCFFQVPLFRSMCQVRVEYQLMYCINIYN